MGRERGAPVRPARVRAGAVGVLVLMATALVTVGCGEDEGVAAGATVNAYFGAPLCAGARGELMGSDGRAGDVRVQVICLDETSQGKRLDLATVGANARRATEDSTAIAYVEPPGPANRFAQPIVEEAGIAWVRAAVGKFAIRRVLKAVGDAGSGSLRDEVRKTLEAE